MRLIKENELGPATQKMLEIFFDTLDISLVTKGLDPEKARRVIYETLYWDMAYYAKHGEVFTYDDDYSGIVFLINGKKHSFIKHAITSLKSSKTIKSILTKEELRIFAENSKEVQAVHSFKWYKKRDGNPYYLAHIGIVKERRRSGIFRKMMEFIYDHVEGQASEIAIETFVPKTASIYEHLGFELIETVEANDKSFQEYRMIKKL